jgi:molybdate transport system substrate-binding protein
MRAVAVARACRAIAVVALAMLLAACGPPAAPAGAQGDDAEVRPLVVHAAASLKESMDAIADAYAAERGQPVQMVYAASSALARQIEQGAPADVFFSADIAWMDWLQARGLVDPATRIDLLGNTLVLVAPADGQAQPLVLAPGTDLAPLLGERGRIALALTASVPAGKYAKAAFESLNIWPALAPRVAEAENVRAALLLVARGEAPLGVVYGSDARAEPRVRVLATFPARTHPPIVYAVAPVSRATDAAAAREFIDWLQSDAAAAVFRGHGFTVR